MFENFAEGDVSAREGRHKIPGGVPYFLRESLALGLRFGLALTTLLEPARKVERLVQPPVKSRALGKRELARAQEKQCLELA